jgi:hypothetical protein
MARKSIPDGTPQPQDGLDGVLQCLQPLGWSHGEHPPNERQVDSILAMRWEIMVWGLDICRIGRRFVHCQVTSTPNRASSVILKSSPFSSCSGQPISTTV